VLKSKVEGLKVDIREWSKVEYGNLDMRLHKFKEEIEGLDIESEEGLLTNLEGEEWKSKFEELWRSRNRSFIQILLKWYQNFIFWIKNSTLLRISNIWTPKKIIDSNISCQLNIVNFQVLNLIPPKQ